LSLLPISLSDDDMFTLVSNIKLSAEGILESTIINVISTSL